MLSSLFESGTSIQWSDLLICILVSLALGLLVARVHMVAMFIPKALS